MKKVPKLEGKGSLSEDAAVATGRARGNKGEDYLRSLSRSWRGTEV